MTKSVRIRDWRLPDRSELTPEQARSRILTMKERDNGVLLEIETIDGKQSQALAVELDKGFIRVRAYSTPEGREEPLGEMWVGQNLAHYEKP